MSVTSMGDRLEAACETFEEEGKQKRLLEQMISYIDFVKETTSKLNPNDPLLRELQKFVDVFDLRHEKIVSRMVANDNGKRIEVDPS